MHALVVGGTGMLMPVVEQLIDDGYRVSVIASRPSSLQALGTYLQSKASELNALAVDYHDDEKLQEVLLEAIRRHGPITLTVAWIHSSAADAPLAIAELVTGDFFHVRSAGASQLDFQDPFDVISIKALADIDYHQITLGFVLENTAARWLTNQEIAQGVIAAIKEAKAYWTIGTTKPWQSRP